MQIVGLQAAPRPLRPHPRGRPGHLRSDRERVIVIGGYTPPMFQAWNGQEPSAAFIEQTPEHLKALISGGDKWRWQQQHRSLEMPLQR